MKKDGSYKFNIQFPAETEEQILAGELLERRPRQKGILIVEALNAYIKQHPELLRENCKIEIHNRVSFDQEKIENLVKRLVSEYMTANAAAGGNTCRIMDEEEMEDNISQMLDNLNFFQ